MNVYLINLSFGLAGIERRFANIWRALRSRGHVRPILVVPDTLAEILAGAGLTSETDPDIWPIREHPWLRALGRVPVPEPGASVVAVARSRAAAWAYREAWRRIAADPLAVVHVGMNCSALVPPDLPLVYECVDSTLTQLGTRHFRRAATRRSIVHCQTDRIRQALEDTMSPEPTVWTTVVSPSYFATYPEASVPPQRDPALVAFVGRFAPEKRPLLFLEVLAKVRAAGVEARGLMLGEGPLLGQIHERIKALGLESSVWVGFTADPSERLREAAVFVTLQSGDNYGSQSLLEAMGAGCAVVATAVGETGRLVTAETGVMAPAETDALAAALSSLLRSPDRTAAMGCAASRLARTAYSADAYAAFLESLYIRAVDWHRATPVTRAAAHNITQ